MTADAKTKRSKKDIEILDSDACEIHDKLVNANEVSLCGILSVPKNTVTCVQLSVLFGLLLIVGGGIFHAIEHPNEVKVLDQLIQEHDLEYTELIKILTNYTKVEADALELYERLQPHYLGFEPIPEHPPQWSFPHSIIFSFTIITTIGYGHFVPATFAGQMFLIIYALIGIPIAGLSLGYIAERALYMFTWLSKIGKDKAEEAFRHFDQDNSGELEKEEFKAALKFMGLDLTAGEFTKLWDHVDLDGGGTVDLDEFREAIQFMRADVTEAAGQKNKVVITLIGIFGWLAFGVIVFTFTEKWSVFKSLYFLFVSLTTIGLGDYTPETPIGMVFLILFAMVGLGLVAVLFTLLQSIFSEMETAREKLSKVKKERKDDVILLKQIPIFAAMTDDEIDRILEKTNTIEFGSNIDIIKEGTEIDLFYILMSGRVIISEINSAEKQEISAPSFLFGSAMLENPNLRESEVTVRTIEDVRVLSVSREDWEITSGTKHPNVVDIDVENGHMESSIYVKDIICSKDLEYSTASLGKDSHASSSWVRLIDEIARIPIITS